METKKKKRPWLISLLFILFVIYMGLYVALQTGYYQATNDVINTAEQIKQFEQDIKDGKPIDINSYLIDKKNYNNKVTDFWDATTHTIESIFNTGIKKIFNLVSYLFS